MASKKKPRADGRYVIKRIVEGEPKYFCGYSLDEAEDKARAAKAHSITNNDTYKTWLDYWLDNVTKPNVEPETYVNYSTLIKTHLTGEGTYMGNKRLRDITTQELRQFLTKKLETMAPTSVTKLHMFIKASLALAAADGVIFKSPAAALKRPKPSIKNNKYLHVETVRSLIDIARFQSHKVMLLLLWTSGLRREELLALYWSDISKGNVSVRRAVKKGRNIVLELKTPSAYRTIPLPKETLDEIGRAHV